MPDGKLKKHLVDDMPNGKPKKLKKKKGTGEEAADAATDSAASSIEMKAKRKHKKKSLSAAATVTCSALLPKKKKKKKKSKRPKDKAAVADLASPSSVSKTTEKKRKRDRKDEKGQMEKIDSGGSEDKQQQEGRNQNKEIANGGSEGQQQSPAEVYLVIRHVFASPAYSVFRLEHAVVTADHPLPVPSHVKYLDAMHDMSFAAVNSPRRSWIVGVGGCTYPGYPDWGETVVFDCRTEQVGKGPRPTSSKYEPALFVVGEKVYALARMPNVWKRPDFPPWFEVLDLSGSSCVDGKLTGCSWLPLPPPPLFPVLNSEGKRIDQRAPIVDVDSYAVVGRRYIVLSTLIDPFTLKEAGTVAYDTRRHEWHHVDCRKDLPFIGEAVPYEYESADDGLYLARSKSQEWNDLTAYRTSITKTKNKKGTSIAAAGLSMAIVEVPVMTIGTTNRNFPGMSGQFFSCLGNGIICAVRCSTEGLTCHEELTTDNIFFNIHRCVDAAEEESKTEAGEIVLAKNPAMYAFHVQEPTYKFIAPSLVAALCFHLI